MLELYHAAISTCSQKVRLCLAEKRLEWVSHPVNFATGDHLTQEYLRLNPNGVVPTLLHDGQPVMDSSVICEYLQEVFPEQGQPLMPADSLGRARVRAWMRYIEEVPTTAIRYSSFNKLFTGFFANMSDEDFQAYSNRLPLRKGFYRQFAGTGFSEQAISDSMERLRQTVERINEAVKNQPFLAGEHISLADICVLPPLVRMEDLEFTRLWEDCAPFKRWYQQMCARPSFEQAYFDGARVSPNKPPLG
ncbi:glutathione S-transferase family protein [Porticoccus sp. GXU_MW_L64]